MPPVVVTQYLDNLFSLLDYFIPVTTMDHGKEVIVPFGLAAGAVVGVADKIKRANLFTAFIYLVIRNIPHRHAVAAKPQSVVVGYGTDAPDNPVLQHPVHACHHLVCGGVQFPGDLLVGLRNQGEPRLGGDNDLPVQIVQG